MGAIAGETEVCQKCRTASTARVAELGLRSGTDSCALIVRSGPHGRTPHRGPGRARLRTPSRRRAGPGRRNANPGGARRVGWRVEPVGGGIAHDHREVARLVDDVEAEAQAEAVGQHERRCRPEHVERAEHQGGIARPPAQCRHAGRQPDHGCDDVAILPPGRRAIGRHHAREQQAEPGDEAG